MRPVHLRPTAPVAPRVLLPGDPGRALMLAQELLAAPKMANHHRGLWGYTGTASDGEALTIQATGMGAASAAIVLEELAALGVVRAVRVGTCGSLVSAVAAGETVACTGAVGFDGVSRGFSGPAALVAEGRPVCVASGDHFYARGDFDDRARAAGAAVWDLETAALLAVGARLGVAVGSVLVVLPLDDVALEAAAKVAGRSALAALSSACVRRARPGPMAG